ncbi:PEGA domain-containing protein [Humisphaera borealis]|uniref:PD40 domain-containing protein n=1 Tax=Humisphaera borealis TaxID=2807512 RepID=A0A7M2WTE8_9BACT|nr:PEGA domain-containing protein [Humisphaera borealis]QOV88534.1 PD40 domain-containing protein [Humisphaera borealis]
MRSDFRDRAVLNSILRLTLLLAVATTAVGCGGGRLITIKTVPADASIVVDGVPRPKAPITERFSFGGGQFHTVFVSRPGYTDKTILLDGTSEQTEVTVTLKPRSRRVRFIVTPLPAIVKIGGKPVADAAVTQASTELEFAVDASGGWIPHVVSAERPGFRRTERVIRFTDADAVYTLPLEPERKTVVIKTEPAGADVIVDGTSFGPSPVTLEDLVIATDPQTNAWVDRAVQAIKPGYEPATSKISWDNGQTEYLLKLGIRTKTIRLKTEPPGAIVRMGQKVLPHKTDGLVELPLDYAPLNASGEMPVHELTISPPAGANNPATTLKIGWEEGKVDYAVTLSPPPNATATATTKPAVTTAVATLPSSPVTPVTTRPAVPTTTATAATTPSVPPITGTGAGLAMIKPAFRLEKSRWFVDADPRKVPLTRDVNEPDGRKPVLVARAPAGATVDGVVTSPDGGIVAWATLRAVDGSLRSQLFAHTVASNKPPVELTDGQALDLMPSFSPDGQRLLFASDRISAGQLATYEVMINLPGFAVRAAPGETSDTELWPSLDSSPRPRLYTESRPTDGSPSRLVAIETVTGKRTDLEHPGTQPRISPRSDAIVFVRGDPNTGKRDIWLLKIGENAPVNLTRSPNDDDFDPTWSKTGSRIAFASDRRLPGHSSPAQPSAAPPITESDINLWVLRVSKPSEAIPVTQNPARDDNPAWSGDDSALYFRSSRGGEWGVWKADLPK